MSEPNDPSRGGLPPEPVPPSAQPTQPPAAVPPPVQVAPPSPDPMATYRGPTQADVLRQFTADSERARAAGYTPVSQAWAQENGEEVMRVRFARTEAATPPPVTPPVDPPPPATPSWGAPSAAASGGSTSGGGLRTAIIVGAVVVLALAGLGAIGLANSPQPSEALATRTPSAVATSTRSPAATAAAAASGGNAGTAADKWIAFAGWVGETMPTLADEANALADAANAGDVDGVVKQANKIEDTTNEVLDYLDSHPPADCYADVHYATRSAIDEYRTAAVAAGKKDFDTAASHLDDANTQIQKLPDMLSGTDCLS